MVRVGIKRIRAYGEFSFEGIPPVHRRSPVVNKSNRVIREPARVASRPVSGNLVTIIEHAIIVRVRIRRVRAPGQLAEERAPSNAAAHVLVVIRDVIGPPGIPGISGRRQHGDVVAVQRSIVVGVDEHAAGPLRGLVGV